jgi:hypothetical protein
MMYVSGHLNGVAVHGSASGPVGVWGCQMGQWELSVVIPYMRDVSEGWGKTSKSSIRQHKQGGWNTIPTPTSAREPNATTDEVWGRLMLVPEGTVRHSASAARTEPEVCKRR